jgi:hypothetical protein
MASIVYPMILFIFIFGAGMTYINETQMYTVQMPESGVQSNLSQASSANDALLQTSKDSGLNYIEMLQLMGKTVFGGLLAIFTLGPLLQSFGIPIGLVGWLISPLGIVLVFWLVEMWLGRPVE